MNEKTLEQAIDKLFADRDAAFQSFTQQIDQLKAAQKALKSASQIINGRTLRLSLPKIKLPKIKQASSSNGNERFKSLRDPARAEKILTRMRECFRPGVWFTSPQLAALTDEDQGYIRYKITRPLIATGELEVEGKLNHTKYRIPGV